MQKTRELWVDYTKVFACILVVIGHLLQGLNKANIEWNENLYNYINNFIYVFHMPLFMCLSGYLYEKYTKIGSWKEYFKFIKKKLINLGVPYFIFYIAFVLINMLFASSVNSPRGIDDILNILTNPMPPFWFLYALFFIFLIIPLLEKLLKNSTYVILILAIILHIGNIFVETGIYAIDIVCEYLVYFYLGAIISKKLQAKEFSTNYTIILGILFVALTLGYCYLKINSILNESILDVLKFILAIYGTFISIAIFRKLTVYLKNNYIINKIAKNTFPIYLMHTIFSAGMRIVLLKIGITNFYIHVILGLVLGIIGPIIVAEILKITRYGNIMLYPIKTVNEIKKEKVDRQIG